MERASEIKRDLEEGKISHEQAVELFQQNRKVVPYRPKNSIENLKRIGGEIFNHNNAQEHYEQRMDIEEGFRHIVGTPIYGAIAAVDAVIDAASFGVTEIVEDATFLVSRTIYRARDGWERGKIK